MEKVTSVPAEQNSIRCDIDKWNACREGGGEEDEWGDASGNGKPLYRKYIGMEKIKALES